MEPNPGHADPDVFTVYLCGVYGRVDLRFHRDISAPIHSTALTSNIRSLGLRNEPNKNAMGIQRMELFRDRRCVEL